MKRLIMLFVFLLAGLTLSAQTGDTASIFGI